MDYTANEARNDVLEKLKEYRKTDEFRSVLDGVLGDIQEEAKKGKKRTVLSMENIPYEFRDILLVDLEERGFVVTLSNYLNIYW
jgi:hypothetical protein